MIAYRLTRDVWWPGEIAPGTGECLGAAAGSVVYAFYKPTYGCVSPHGLAVSVTEGEYPFFEAPLDALEPLPPHGMARPDLGLTADGYEQAREEHRHDVAMGRYYGDDQA